jgi:hypothetical protein
MAQDFLNYPKARIAVNGGELQDAYDINMAFEDGETPVHTFRNAGEASGSVGGKRSCTVTFKSAISEDGFERDYMGQWRKRRVVSLRVKVPGKTFTVVGRYSKPSITGNIDSFVDFSISLTGRSSEA